MITCWNIRFKNAQELWEFPGCYVSTVHILRKRLRKMAPEAAVLPDYHEFMGKQYPSIYSLHFELGDVLSRAALYKRLGLIYKGKKLTAAQATCPKIWARLRRLPRGGSYGTLLISPK
jgi:hypothetical protein